jgi:hypothetical protein
MTRLRSGFFVTIGLLGIFLGPVLLVVAWQLWPLVQNTRPAPQKMSLADLIEKGPGDNLHAELTDFKFGTSIRKKEGRSGLWVPLLPRGGAKEPRHRVFLRTRLDEAQLAAATKDQSLNVLVASGLPVQLVWRIQPDDTLRSADPHLDPSTAILLIDSTFVIGGVHLLGDGRLYDRQTAEICTIAGWAILGLGLMGMLLSSGFSQVGRKLPSEAGAPGDAQARAALAAEQPRSVHTMAFARSLFGMIMGLLGSVLTVAAVLWAGHQYAAWFLDLLRNASGMNLIALVLAALMALLFVGASPALALVSLETFFLRIPQIAVCPSGLRWGRCGRDRMALWSDIERMHHDVSSFYVRGRTYRSDVFKITLKTGEKLFFTEGLTDYAQFVASICSIRADVARS